MDVIGDHVEPGVSMKLDDPAKNSGLNSYACVGNQAKLLVAMQGAVVTLPEPMAVLSMF